MKNDITPMAKVRELTKEVIVTRRRWLRGNEQGLLRNKSHKMCCLGFACMQSGVPAKDLVGHGAPEDIANNHSYVVNGLVYKNNNDSKYWYDHENWVNDAVAINDRMWLSDKDREAKLKKLFAKGGVKLIFVD